MCCGLVVSLPSWLAQRSQHPPHALHGPSCRPCKASTLLSRRQLQLLPQAAAELWLLAVAASCFICLLSTVAAATAGAGAAAAAAVSPFLPDSQQLLLVLRILAEVR